MKKIAILLSSFAILGFNTAMAQGEKDEKMSVIKEITAETAAQIKEAGLDDETVKKFTDCLEKDFYDKLNLDEAKLLLKVSKMKETDTPSEEDLAKIMEMQTKLTDLGAECQSLLGM